MHVWDIVLSDYNMPQFSAPAALELVREQGVDLPFIIVSGSIGEETAVAALKEGANDYIMKTSLLRLVPAVEREIRDLIARRERRTAQEALAQSEEKYRGLVENLNDVVFATDNKGRVSYVSPAAESMLGYSPAEIVGRPFDDFVLPEDVDLVHAAFADVLASRLHPSEYRLVSQSGKPHWVRTSSRPLLRGGQVAGITGVLTDVTERVLAGKRLEGAFQGAIQALGATTEARDPYTAGHQERVAKLACAIGVELHMGDESLEGLRVACLVHDIGKISVPAEILSKPARLTEIELSLIREHPRTGHRILSGIAFPWPCAETVLQHHERMDGSGYPDGLTGDDIMIEARVLAVADVVEAMASHRPYRPALGIEKALEEIARGAETVYDGQAAAACRRLFAEGRFAFEEQRQRPGERSSVAVAS